MIPSKIKIKILALRRIFAALGSKGLIPLLMTSVPSIIPLYLYPIGVFSGITKVKKKASILLNTFQKTVLQQKIDKYNLFSSEFAHYFFLKKKKKKNSRFFSSFFFSRKHYAFHTLTKHQAHN